MIRDDDLDVFDHVSTSLNRTGTVDFERVSFANAKFSRTDFGWSDLVDCTFRGVVNGLFIGGWPVADAPAHWRLSGVDMLASRPRRVEFRGAASAPRVSISRYPRTLITGISMTGPRF